MGDKLRGKRVAVLAADMFERVELAEPRRALVDAGAEVELISLKPGEIQGFDHFEPASKEKVDKTVEEVSASDYDALMVPGGVGNPDQLRGDENAVQFVRDFFEQGKPAAVICHGPWVLVEAGVVRGRKLTSWPTLQRPTSATRAATGSTRRSSSTAASSRAASRTTSRPSTRR
jgi:protease I